MTENGPAAYGDRIAGVYDEWFAVPKDAEDAASFLSELAGQGSALELGIGTGRVALPLFRRGVEVRGIDASEAMVEKLREKPGGENVPKSPPSRSVNAASRPALYPTHDLICQRAGRLRSSAA